MSYVENEKINIIVIHFKLAGFGFICICHYLVDAVVLVVVVIIVDNDKVEKKNEETKLEKDCR